MTKTLKEKSARLAYYGIVACAIAAGVSLARYGCSCSRVNKATPEFRDYEEPNKQYRDKNSGYSLSEIKK